MNGSDSITVLWKVSEEQRVYKGHLVNQQPCHTARSKGKFRGTICSSPSMLKIQKYSEGLFSCPFMIYLSTCPGPKSMVCWLTPQRHQLSWYAWHFKRPSSAILFAYRCAHWQCTVSRIMNISETWFNFFKTNLSFLIDSLKQRPV